MTSPPVPHDTTAPGTRPAGARPSGDGASGDGAPTDQDARWDRRLVVAALGTSGATAALTGLFAARPDTDPLVADNTTLGGALLPGPALAWVFLATALLGVVTAATALARPAPATGRLVGPVAALQVLAFGFLAQGSGTLSVAGYLVALAVPVLTVWAGVQVFRTRPAWRLPVALAGALAVVGVVVAHDAFGTWLGALATGLARERWGLLAVLLPLATATSWAGLALARAWRRGSLRGATAWVTRHRRLFTVLAALGPLPYALARLTWLTPWPQLGGEDASLAIKIQGLSLSSGAWVGVVLTLGLILPWGERFPRWFPRRAGEPVPPAAAIVPGGTVAVMLCGAAIPMLVMMGGVGALYFPAWFWGPTLALAVWGYAGHRAGISAGEPAGHAPASRRRAATGRRRAR